MQVTLLPLAHGSREPLEIQDALFSIGRNEPAFANYGERALSFLSRRHARIFIENGAAYVADLGSRNGTRLNNQPVEHQPAQLKQGDELSFANTLRFEVNITYDTGDGHVQAPLPFSLTLAAVKENGEHLVSIASFPFLVGTNSDNLLDPASADQAKRFLSRRHAHFFVNGDALYLEDLASTNGTYVNGERLADEPREIRHQDRLEFGSPHCAFQVALQRAGESGGKGEAGEQTYHTAFISAADSFLDIFCMEEEAVEESVVEEVSKVESGKNGKPKKSGPLRRFASFIKQLRSAFADPGGGAKKARWIAPLMVLCAAILIAPFLITTEKQQIEQLHDEQQFLQAAVAANGFLSNEPQRDDIHELGLKSLLNHVMPRWQEYMHRGSHAQALELLDSMQSRTARIEMSEALLMHLAWVTRLDRYIQQRGGLDSSIDIFSDEVEISGLLDWWQADSKKHRSHARIILDHHAPFEQFDVQASSQLRALENEQSVYLNAIENLLTRVSSQLEAGKAGELTEVIDAFAEQYPRLTGLDDLGRDLQAYLPLEQAISRGDMNVAQRLIAMTTFKTPPFIVMHEELSGRLQASANSGKQLQAAESAWQTGQLEIALDLWQQLAEQSGQDAEQARQLYANKRELLNLYNNLPVEPDRPDFSSRLNEFAARLDKDYDRVLLQRVRQHLQQHGEQLNQDAEMAWRRGSRAWQDYRKAGGIGGLLRLEEEVSDKFIAQVERLNLAYAGVQQAEQVYQALGRSFSAEQIQTRERISAEIRLQKRSLEQLSIVLGQELLDKKLSLFSEVDSY